MFYFLSTFFMFFFFLHFKTSKISDGQVSLTFFKQITPQPTPKTSPPKYNLKNHANIQHIRFLPADTVYVKNWT